MSFWNGRFLGDMIIFSGGKNAQFAPGANPSQLLFDPSKMAKFNWSHILTAQRFSLFKTIWNIETHQNLYLNIYQTPNFKLRTFTFTPSPTCIHRIL